MIATEAALYGAGNASGSGVTSTATLQACGCGQELPATHREHCPRCGCCVR